MKKIIELTVKGFALYIKEQNEIKISTGIINVSWVKSILLALEKGNKCYTSLRHGLTKNGIMITEKMLGIRLLMLQKEGLITKVDSPTSVSQSDYTLTKQGKRAMSHIHISNKWAEDHDTFKKTFKMSV